MKKILSLLLIATSFICLTACSNEGNKEELPNIPKEHYMAVGESFNLGYKTNWVSSNTFSATVDGEGVITAVKVGEAKIYSTKEDLSCNVYVYPSYSLYRDPITEWGISQEELKKEKVTLFGEEIIEEDAERIAYKTSNTIAPIEIYNFENDSLTSSVVLIHNSYSEKLGLHLSQRMKAINFNEGEGIILFIDAESPSDAKIIAGIIEYDSSYISILYTQYTEEDIETIATRSGSKLFDKINSELLPINISQEAE